jgi:hypothetical protein
MPHSRRDSVNSEFEPQYSEKLQNECITAIPDVLKPVIYVLDIRQGT